MFGNGCSNHPHHWRVRRLLRELSHPPAPSAAQAVDGPLMRPRDGTRARSRFGNRTAHIAPRFSNPGIPISINPSTKYSTSRRISALSARRESEPACPSARKAARNLNGAATRRRADLRWKLRFMGRRCDRVGGRGVYRAGGRRRPRARYRRARRGCKLCFMDWRRYRTGRCEP